MLRYFLSYMLLVPGQLQHGKYFTMESWMLPALHRQNLGPIALAAAHCALLIPLPNPHSYITMLSSDCTTLLVATDNRDQIYTVTLLVPIFYKGRRPTKYIQSSTLQSQTLKWRICQPKGHHPRSLILHTNSYRCPQTSATGHLNYSTPYSHSLYHFVECRYECLREPEAED